MAVQLKHDIRGYHAGNISKRYLREAEAADEFELSSNEVIACSRGFIQASEDESDT